MTHRENAIMREALVDAIGWKEGIMEAYSDPYKDELQPRRGLAAPFREAERAIRRFRHLLKKLRRTRVL